MNRQANYNGKKRLQYIALFIFTFLTKFSQHSHVHTCAAMKTVKPEQVNNGDVCYL